MAQDFTALSTTELYAALLTHINDRDAALALGLDPATTTVTNPLTNSVRWNSANGYWEKFGGVSWAPLASSYAINITGTAPWAGITGKPTTVTGYGITDGITTANIGAQHVTNSDQLGGQVPSYYQAALGFTPVQQGGGTGQGTNKVYIGWNAAGLYLQVAATNYAAVWPIGISGNAATAATATTAATAGTVTAAAQPAITSVGTLTTLSVSGAVTVPNATTATQAVALGQVLPLSSMSSSRVTTTVAQSIVANTWTQIQFNTVGYDDLTEFNTTTHQWTVKAAGTYFISAGVTGTQASTATNRVVAVFVNGASNTWLQGISAGLGNTTLAGASPFRLALGDVVAIYYYSAVADTINTNGVFTYATLERVK